MNKTIENLIRLTSQLAKDHLKMKGLLQEISAQENITLEDIRGMLKVMSNMRELSGVHLDVYKTLNDNIREH